MAARRVPDRFLVAFSLAGEQRDLVRRVAQVVERQLGRPNVFFDEWFEHYVAGGDADLKLQEIYANAALAVVCVSEAYGGKPWTRAEHAAIRARLMLAEQSDDERDKLGVLPIRVGEGDVGGILFNTIVPDIRKRSPEEAAGLVVDRLGLMDARLDMGSAWGTSTGYTHLVEAGETLDRIAARYLDSPSDWRQLAVANRLTDPLAIRPGQVLTTEAAAPAAGTPSRPVAEGRRRLLAQNVAWPLQIDERGGIALAGGAEAIEGSIGLILSTVPGERLMNPDFGCRIRDVLTEPFDDEKLTAAGAIVREAVTRWEPRAAVDQVTAEPVPLDPARVDITISYRVRATEERNDMVYPLRVVPRGDR